MLYNGFRINLWFVLILWSCLLACSIQSIYGQGIKHKKLKTTNQDLEGQIYISHLVIDSTGEFEIFLVNQTAEELLVSCDGRAPKFTVEVMNTIGEWKEIQEVIRNCDSGSTGHLLPKYSFTWKKHELPSGDFETMVRFSIPVNNMLVLSEHLLVISQPIKVKIPLYLFWGKYEWLNNRIKEAKTLERRNRLICKKIEFCIKDNVYSQAFELNKKLLQDYPNYKPAYYTLGQILYKYGLATNSNLSKAQKIAFCSAAITEFSTIPEGHKYHQKTQAFIKILNETLPTAKEWETLNDLECKTIDGEQHCYLEPLLKDWIKIRFK